MAKKGSRKKKHSVSNNVARNVDVGFDYGMSKLHKKHFDLMMMKMAKGLISNDLKTTTDTSMEILNLVWSNQYFDYQNYQDYFNAALSAAAFYHYLNDLNSVVRALNLAKCFAPLNADCYLKLAQTYIEQNKLHNAFVVQKCLSKLCSWVPEAIIHADHLRDEIIAKFIEEYVQRMIAVRNKKQIPVRGDELLEIDRRQVINWFFLDDNDFIRDKFHKYSSDKYSNVDDLPNDEKTASNLIIFHLAKGKFDDLLFDAYDAWKDDDEKEVCNYLFVLLLYFHQHYVLAHPLAVMYLQSFSKQKDPSNEFHTIYNAMVAIMYCCGNEIGAPKKVTTMTEEIVNGFDLTFCFRCAAHNHFFGDTETTRFMLTTPKPLAEQFMKRPNDYKLFHVLKHSLDIVSHPDPDPDECIKFPMKDFKFPPLLVDIILTKISCLPKNLFDVFVESVLKSYIYLPCYQDSEFSSDEEPFDYHSCANKAGKLLNNGKLNECLKWLKTSLKFAKTMEEIQQAADSFFKFGTHIAWVKESQQMDTNICRFLSMKADSDE
uniref:Uncharacterized protein n=1 Tax=Panagrolaimus sp. JU765 TaxID=591449 RepID=A0AC34QEX2_9BILA